VTTLIALDKKIVSLKLTDDDIKKPIKPYDFNASGGENKKLSFLN
jgi:hypothetical protein